MAEQELKETRPKGPEDPSSDLGFGRVVSSQRELRLLNRDGSFNVQKRGRGLHAFLAYSNLVSTSWDRFFLFVAIAYLAGKFPASLGQIARREIKAALQVLQVRRGFRTNRHACLLEKSGFCHHSRVRVRPLHLLHRRLQQRSRFPGQRRGRANESQQMIRGTGRKLTRAIPSQSDQAAL